ncbi:MAG: hypothetical protein WBC85_13130 [Planktotalea sp.]|uniref:hypothetical protein n=1 Tax=Planktotalea sp. TaxID=2029877 RepID=UPI003C76CA5B
MKLLSQPLTMTLATIVCGALCATLLIVPQLLAWLFQIELDHSGAIFARRAGMLFCGIAVICWHSRALDPSPASRAIFLGLGTMMAGLALLGLVEFAQGRVGVGIFLAIVAEIAFSVHFLSFAKK